MPLTPFQRQVCRILARNRTTEGASYVAGGAALNAVLGGPRLSHDVDLFSDTVQALDATFAADRKLLAAHGYRVELGHVSSLGTFVGAKVIDPSGHVVELQWVRDSAFRFFPLQPNDDFGVTLHPADLATNKVMALVGRVQFRDWYDVLLCHTKVQPLGLLIWAGVGKDSGYTPLFALDQASRNAHWPVGTVEQVQFEGPRPDLIALKKLWIAALDEAEQMFKVLDPDNVGTCVCGPDGRPFNGDLAALKSAAAAGALVYRPGHIRGVWPEVVG